MIIVKGKQGAIIVVSKKWIGSGNQGIKKLTLKSIKLSDMFVSTSW